MNKIPEVLEYKQKIQKNLPRCILIAGEDPTLGDEVIEIARKQLSSRSADLQIISLVGTEIEVSDFYSDFFTMPLFGGERLFIIREAGGLFKRLVTSTGRSLSGEGESLQKGMQNFPAATSLIMVDTAKDTSATVRKVFPGVDYYKGRNLYDNEQQGYIIATAREAGIKLDNSAVDYLLSLTEGRFNLVRLAVAQLSREKHRFDSAHALTQREVAGIVDVQKSENIFKFIETVLWGRTYDALRALPNLDIESGSYLPLLSLLLKELKALRRFHSGRAAGLDQNAMLDYLEIPRNKPSWRTRRLNDYSRLAERLPPDRLEFIIGALWRLQLDFKGSIRYAEEQQVALQQFIRLF